MKDTIAIHRQQEFVRCVCNKCKIQTRLFLHMKFILSKHLKFFVILHLFCVDNKDNLEKNSINNKYLQR